MKEAEGKENRKKSREEGWETSAKCGSFGMNKRNKRLKTAACGLSVMMIVLYLYVVKEIKHLIEELKFLKAWEVIAVCSLEY